MRGMISVDDVMAALPKKRRAAIEARGKDLLTRVHKRMTLGELRKKRNISQTAIAESLGIGQMQISRLEKRKDPRLSTIERTVQAMGGKLTLVATFPDQEPVELFVQRVANR
jgi:DNA-binding phage protein